MPAEPADLGVDASALVALVDGVSEDIVRVRRDLHAHPELAWAEQRTTMVVAERLEQAGVKVQMLPRSGLVADIGGGAANAYGADDAANAANAANADDAAGDGAKAPTVALRADIDALPVADLTDDPWASTVDGVAHACGHDAHTACLLGAGLALAALDQRDPLPGHVR